MSCMQQLYNLLYRNAFIHSFISHCHPTVSGPCWPAEISASCHPSDIPIPPSSVLSTPNAQLLMPVALPAPRLHRPTCSSCLPAPRLPRVACSAHACALPPVCLQSNYHAEMFKAFPHVNSPLWLIKSISQRPPSPS